jgi:hypothetical protein
LKLALAILAAVLLLAGCGQAKDPFVGTWQSVGNGPGDGVAITKASGSYRVTFVASFKPERGGSWRFLRHGSTELMVIVKYKDPDHPSDHWQRVERIDFNSATGRLTYTENGVHLMRLSRVSDSTVPPPPWPTAAPWDASHDPASSSGRRPGTTARACR